MRSTIIEWDGKHLPKELCELPPGMYLLEAVDGVTDPTVEEAAGIRLSMDQIEARPDLDKVRLRAMQIDWDGANVSENVMELPPGIYLIQFVDDIHELTPEEEAGIREALDELEAGHGIPYEDAMRELRASLPSP